MSHSIDVRPFQSKEEITLLIDYFFHSSDEFLVGMGVDPKRLPDRETWLQDAWADQRRPDEEKQRFYLAWIYDGQIVGHSSISKIKPGEEAYIHLHLWKPNLRRGGVGTEFFRRSANFFLNKFGLKKLYCEPYAENPAPNKVLQKLGFKFVERYKTVPGAINFEQDVNRYELDHEITSESGHARLR